MKGKHNFLKEYYRVLPREGKFFFRLEGLKNRLIVAILRSMDASEFQMVRGWLSPTWNRSVSGVVTGWLSALLALSVAGTLSQASGEDWFFPLRVLATLLIGPAATEWDHPESLQVGGGVLLLLAGFWGLVYGHFVQVQKPLSAFAMGLVWGFLGWVFHWNLFFQSVPALAALDLSRAGALWVFETYGAGFLIFPWVKQLLQGFFRTPSENNGSSSQVAGR